MSRKGAAPISSEKNLIDSVEETGKGLIQVKPLSKNFNERLNAMKNTDLRNMIDSKSNCKKSKTSTVRRHLHYRGYEITEADFVSSASSGNQLFS